MAQRFESRFESFDDAQLFFQVWQTDQPRGTLLLTHGLGEHSDCYEQLVKDLNRNSWDIWSWDLRGHGRSPGKRGYISDFSFFFKDLFCFLNVVESKKSETGPLVLFGHSLGGLITTRMFETWTPDSVEALVLSSPALGAKLEVSKIKDWLARFSARWAPGLTLYNEITPQSLSRDPAHIEIVEKDPLRHDRISPLLFLGLLENFDLALESAPDIQVPTLLIQGGNDIIVDEIKSREFFDRIGASRKEYLFYPESYHEVFNDLDQSAARQDLLKFLNPMLGSPK